MAQKVRVGGRYRYEPVLFDLLNPRSMSRRATP